MFRFFFRLAFSLVSLLFFLATLLSSFAFRFLRPSFMLLELLQLLLSSFFLLPLFLLSVSLSFCFLIMLRFSSRTRRWLWGSPSCKGQCLVRVHICMFAAGSLHLPGLGPATQRSWRRGCVWCRRLGGVRRPTSRRLSGE